MDARHVITAAVDEAPERGSCRWPRLPAHRLRSAGAPQSVMLRGAVPAQATAAPWGRRCGGGLRSTPLTAVPRRRLVSSRHAARASLPPPPPPPPHSAPAVAVPTVSVAVPSPAPAAAQHTALASAPSALVILASLFALGQLWGTWRSGWRAAPYGGASAARRLRRAADARAPIAIFHDLVRASLWISLLVLRCVLQENCGIPAAVEAWSVAGAVLEALRASGYAGVLRSYTAFGDMALLRPTVRRQLSSTGVRLSDVPSGRKDAADRALLLDLMLFARDTPPPAVVLLITGDRDFAPSAHRLTQLGYTVLLSAPIATAQVAPELLSAAYRRFDWASMACGLVPFEERERERTDRGASNDDDEPEPTTFVRQPSVASLAEAGVAAVGDFRFGRGKNARVGAFVSAAAAAIEREDVDELARVVASAQLSGLKSTREAALLADMRRRLKQREAAAEEVAPALERAILAADPQLAASAVLAARTRGVSGILAAKVAAAERIMRANRAARRTSRGGTPADADEDEEEEEEADEEEDDADDARSQLPAEQPSQRRASAALKEHRLGSRRRLVIDELDAADSWAGRPWIASGAAAEVKADEAAEAVMPPPAAEDPAALVAAYEADPNIPRWFVIAAREGLEGQDFALLSSAIARGAAANLDTSGAASVLAVVTRARSIAGSLVRLSLTRKAQPLSSLIDSLAGLPVAALLTKEIAEARAALERMLATPEPPVVDVSSAECAQFKARIHDALDEEDPVALRAALLDAAIESGMANESAMRRLKVLNVACESVPELQRACKAEDLAVLRARILRVRRDFVLRDPTRSFPKTDGKLLLALTEAVKDAEAVLARLTAEAAASGPASADNGAATGTAAPMVAATAAV